MWLLASEGEHEKSFKMVTSNMYTLLITHIPDRELEKSNKSVAGKTAATPYIVENTTPGASSI